MHNLLITWQRYEIVFICRVFAIHFLLIVTQKAQIVTDFHPLGAYSPPLQVRGQGGGSVFYGLAEIPTSHKHTQIASPQITDTPFTKMMRMAAMPEMNSETHPHFPSL